MDYRYSASFLKLKKKCWFAVWCKITGKEKQEDPTIPPYGDAGNVVHHSLEYYYNHLYDLDPKSALVELKQYFDQWWYESYEITSPKLNVNLYWLCVINAIKLNLKVTDTEKEYNFNLPSKHGPIKIISYVDAENSEDNWQGDWKTATYKKSKLEEFKEQLKFYAYMKYKTEGIIPMNWVYFNKVNKMFKYKWNEATVMEIEKEIYATEEEIRNRLKTMDFPRSSSRQNCFFCAYKNHCSSDLLREAKAEEYEIVFNLKKHKLLIEGAIPDIIHRKIEKELNYLVKNAHFIIQAMKQRGVHYDGIKRIYRRRSYGGETTIGYMHTIHRILKEYAHSKGMKFALVIKDWRNQEILKQKIDTPKKLNVPYDLYEFQTEAVDTLIKYRWGICEIGTGGGKTAIAAECIRKIGLKTLFIIDNKDLLMQTKDEYEKMLNLECGIVGMGHRDWDKPVVLATIQTIEKHAKEFAGQLSKFPFVIYDETHIVASKSFAKISKYLTNTKYRFGFSATARRDDGDDNLIYANTGTVVYKLNAKDLIAKNVLVPPIATFYKYDCKPVVTDNWQSEYEAGIVNNKVRNDIIIKKALELEAQGKQLMIICTRVKHCEHFIENIPNSKLIYGKTKDTIRYDLLKDFKDGKFKILVGNLKIFNKGLNINCLDGVINAAGNAGDVLTVQTIGRPLRKAPGKVAAFYIDFVDCGTYLYKHSMSRMEALKAEEYQVNIEE